jgi:hypothetical protein
MMLGRKIGERLVVNDRSALADLPALLIATTR